jgi:hypothetical protein
MQAPNSHSCRCPDCTAPADHPNKQYHRLLNLFLSRLDEDHRRWFAALESIQHGHGGDCLLAHITGMGVETIRRGRRELANSLEGFPVDRIRRPGGGRRPAEKKMPPLSPP